MQLNRSVKFERDSQDGRQTFNDILQAHIETINSRIDALYGYLSCHACLMNAVE